MDSLRVGVIRQTILSALAANAGLFYATICGRLARSPPPSPQGGYVTYPKGTAKWESLELLIQTIPASTFAATTCARVMSFVKTAAPRP
jgi:hypothetical protein